MGSADKFFEIDLKDFDSLSEEIERLGSDAVRNDVAISIGQQVQKLMYNHCIEMDANNSWDNPSLPTHGAGRKESRWGSDLANRWANEINNGVVSVYLVSTADSRTGFRMKVNGGTLVPVTASALTIPLIPQAHNVKARDYANNTGNSLFTIKRKDKPTGDKLGCLYENTGDGIRPVYALRKSVTFKPWPNALPSDEEFTMTINNAIDAVMELDGDDSIDFE